ncbi:MAG: SIS domain-containing protein [Nitrospinaceae bacterium]|nr:SIS domain-containing protein [Nitrospinaceae bacterium]MBT7857128.1 SIS domain-containing protein [Nitrospinaceae bacterium]
MNFSAREFMADRAKKFSILSDSDFTANIEAISESTLDSLQRGGKILVFGNGGSAALATHFSGELTGRFLRERRPLPAFSLTVDTSALTAIGNDYDYSRTFSRQLEAHASQEDLALGLTTSGNSPNVVLTLKKAKELGIRSAVMTGKSGGLVAEVADIVAIVPSEETDFIQEAHEAAIHYICHKIDDLFCEGPKT